MNSSNKSLYWIWLWLIGSGHLFVWLACSANGTHQEKPITSEQISEQVMERGLESANDAAEKTTPTENPRSPETLFDQEMKAEPEENATDGGTFEHESLAYDTSPERGENIMETTVDVAKTAIIYVEARGDGQKGSGTSNDPYRNLQIAINEAPNGAKLVIAAGIYKATATSWQDPTCGNCDDKEFYKGAAASYGFRLQGRALDIEGAGSDKTTLITNAGYGFLFENAGRSRIAKVKITGGIRDGDGRATDAAIVARYTELLVEDVLIKDNDHLYTGQPDPVVGVGGIFGREGASLTIRNSQILDSSWDGITLYRSDPQKASSKAFAKITNTRVGCTDTRCISRTGRGVGIGITWDASAEITGNHVFKYWKGIGSFGNSRVAMKNNLIREQYGWGVVATGNSRMEAVNNVIHRNGTTGLAAWSTTCTGFFINNIVTENGWNPKEWVGIKTGLWYNTTPSQLRVAYNNVYNNKNFDYCKGGEPETRPCQALSFAGVDGNLSQDPKYQSSGGLDFHLLQGSPSLDTGDPFLKDLDGTRSDMGVFGGPSAPAQLP